MPVISDKPELNKIACNHSRRELLIFGSQSQGQWSGLFVSICLCTYGYVFRRWSDNDDMHLQCVINICDAVMHHKPDPYKS